MFGCVNQANRFDSAMKALVCWRMPHNKQLQRTVIPNRWRGASASFHYALAARSNPQRAAAELRRSATQMGGA